MLKKALLVFKVIDQRYKDNKSNLTDPIQYAVLDIGIGPLNLSLTDLTENIESLKTNFLHENH